MKVLQLPSWYLPEGGHFCLHQSLALKEQGVEVDILANVVLPWRKYKLSVFKYPFKAFFTTENGLAIYRYYSWRYPFSDIKNIEKWTKKTVELFEQYVAQKGTPDLIHVHSSMWGGYAASIIKEKFGIPYVLTEHRGIFGIQTKYSKRKLKKTYISYLQKAFSSASCIIPVSHQLIPKISEYLTSDVTIKVVSNILDTNFFSYKNREEKQEKDKFTFVSVNGYYTEKGYEYLIPAFDRLCKKRYDVYLKFVGENFENKHFQKILKRSKNLDKISFTGELTREGVREELWNADAFVISSIVESQSVSTLEAMSTGLPVVGTEVIPANILTQDIGYRVPVENSKELAKAMLEMTNNKDKFNAEEISRHVINIAGKEQVVGQLISIYREILG